MWKTLYFSVIYLTLRWVWSLSFGSSKGQGWCGSRECKSKEWKKSTYLICNLVSKHLLSPTLLGSENTQMHMTLSLSSGAWLQRSNRPQQWDEALLPSLTHNRSLFRMHPFGRQRIFCLLIENWGILVRRGFVLS